MSGRRRIIVYIATSADGYIARTDGSVDWLNRPRIAGDYGMGTFMKSIDTILWGRKTYDIAAKLGGSAGFGPNIKNYVFSKHSPSSPGADAEFVNQPVAPFARQLRSAPGKNIWMMGGSKIIASFLDEGEIDEFILHVVPTIVGEGIPLVAPRHRHVPLRLRSVKLFVDGVARLHYVVEQPAGKS